MEKKLFVELDCRFIFSVLYCFTVIPLSYFSYSSTLKAIFIPLNFILLSVSVIILDGGL